MKTMRFHICSDRHQCFGAGRFLVLLAVAIILWPQNATGQQPTVPKLTLSQVEQLVSNKVPDSTMSAQIQKRGLSFAPTPAIVESLRAKGAGPLTLAVVEDFFPEAPLAATMQFIRDKLSGLGDVSFNAFTQNRVSGGTSNTAFTFGLSNVIADQNQCRISYHGRFTKNDSPYWDGDLWFSLRDVREIVVKPYTQYQTEVNAKVGIPNDICRSTTPPVVALHIYFQGGAQQIFAFNDVALAERVARAVRHAAKLCGSNNAGVSGSKYSNTSSSSQFALVIDPPSNVRASPSSVSPIVCSVTSKSSIHILGSEGNWYKTDICDGKLGFIYRNQIKF
jgi:hypothetical protein